MRLAAILCLAQITTLALASNIKNLVIFGDANSGKACQVRDSVLTVSDVESSHREMAGPLWSEYLAEAWNASLYSFGYSDSLCTNNFSLQKDEEYIPSFRDQVEGYYNLGLNLDPAETVYAVWFGVKDTIEIDKQKEERPGNAQMVECIGLTLRSINKVFKGSKFVVFNILPIEDIPFYSDTAQVDSISQLVIEGNRLFEKDIANINRHHHSMEIDVMDIHSLVKDVSKDPAIFGYKHASGSIVNDCIEPCSLADKYVWFDGVHFSTAFHKTIATSIIETESFTPRTALTKEPTVQPKTFAIEPSKRLVDSLVKAYDLAKSESNNTYESTLEEDLYIQKDQQEQHLLLVLFILIALAIFFFMKLYKRIKAT